MVQLAAHLVMQQPVGWRFEAVVLQRHFGGTDRFGVAETPHIRPFAQPLRGEIEEQLRAFGQRTGVIGEHHPVLTGLKFVEVEQPFFRRQPVDERQVAFAVLHAVLAHRVLVAQGEGVIGDPGFFQQGTDNGVRLLGLEDAGVGTQTKPPQRRAYLGLIAGAAKTGVALGKAADDTANPALQFAFVPHQQLARLVQHRAEIDAGLAAGQIERQRKRLVQRLAEFKIHHREGGVRQRADLHGKLQSGTVGHLTFSLFPVCVRTQR